MEGLSREVLAKTGTAIVVATVESLGDNELNDYVSRLYKAWGVGRKGHDKGVLIFLAVKERKVKIETGYGAEGFLPDGLVGEILREHAIPQEALTDAKLRLKDYERFQPSLQTETERVQPSQQVTTPPQSTPVADPKAEAWRARNSWFGADEEMTSLALGLHEKLVRSGVDPRSDTYYAEIDKTMRRRFPENFEGDAEQTMEKEEKPSPRTKPANVVAPVTRNTAPRQVRLTPTQVALAKKLGISNQEYAQAMIEMENANG